MSYSAPTATGLSTVVTQSSGGYFMNGKKAKEIRRMTTAMNPGPNWKRLYRLLKKMYVRGRKTNI
jgi:hypothetical protein